MDVQADFGPSKTYGGTSRPENAGDAEYCTGLLADDAVFMVPDFPIQNGRDACAAFLRDMMPSLVEFFDRRITYTGLEVRVVDNIAFDRGEFAFTVRPRSGGDASRVTGKYFWLYARSADGGGVCLVPRAGLVSHVLKY